MSKSVQDLVDKQLDAILHRFLSAPYCMAEIAIRADLEICSLKNLTAFSKGSLLCLLLGNHMLIPGLGM